MPVAYKDMHGRRRRITDQSAANTSLALSSPVGVPHRLLSVTVKYSAAPTQAGVTTELDSGVGAAWDTTLSTGAANAQSTVYAPEGVIVAADDDAFKVTAPAGGAGITSQIAIVVELL